MKKDIQNADVVIVSLDILIKVINYKLEVVKKEKQKREKMIERRKTETIAIKCRRKRGGIYLSSEKKKNYDHDTINNTDPDQAKSKYLV